MTTGPDPALVAECFRENRARLLATVATVQHAIATTGAMQRADERESKPITEPQRAA